MKERGSRVLKCPNCSCEFVYESDLVGHLATFGNEHSDLSMQLFHVEVEYEDGCLHSGADRIVRELADIVFDYKDWRCRVSGVSVKARCV